MTLAIQHPIIQQTSHVTALLSKTPVHTDTNFCIMQKPIFAPDVTATFSGQTAHTYTGTIFSLSFHQNHHTKQQTNAHCIQMQRHHQGQKQHWSCPTPHKQNRSLDTPKQAKKTPMPTWRETATHKQNLFLRNASELGQRASNQYRNGKVRRRWRDRDDGLTATVTSQTVHELRGHTANARVGGWIEKGTKCARNRPVEEWMCSVCVNVCWVHHVVDNFQVSIKRLWVLLGGYLKMRFT